MRIIRDSQFIRGEVPMTKEEVRTLSLAKLNLQDGERYADLGAGTGSVALNMAVNVPNGYVTAVEKEEKGIDLIRKNADNLKVDNIDVIHGKALEELSKMDEGLNGIFVGGSGGELKEIIKESMVKLKKGGKLVLNFITMKNALDAMDTLDQLGVQFDCVQIGVSVLKGRSRMLIANNPIFIIDAHK